MAIVKKYSMTADNLLAGPEIPVLTKNFKVTAGTAMKRGTLLTVNTEGMVSATKKAEESSAVLTNDIDEKATVVTAYVAGRFNRAALICAEGDFVEAHEEELRKAGIHLTVKL